MLARVAHQHRHSFLLALVCLSSAVVPACQKDAGTDEQGTSTESSGDGDGDGDPGDGDGEPGDGDGDGDTGPDCTPGAFGCICDEADMCVEGLVCVDGMCTF